MLFLLGLGLGDRVLGGLEEDLRRREARRGDPTEEAYAEAARALRPLVAAEAARRAQRWSPARAAWVAAAVRGRRRGPL